MVRQWVKTCKVCGIARPTKIKFSTKLSANASRFVVICCTLFRAPTWQRDCGTFKPNQGNRLVMEPAPPTTVSWNTKTCPSRSLISKCYKYFESALWSWRRISPIPFQSIALNLSWHVRIYLSLYFLPTDLRLCFCCQFYGVFICWQPLSVQLPWQLPGISSSIPTPSQPECPFDPKRTLQHSD